MNENQDAAVAANTGNLQTDERIEGIGWGVLLITVGTIWLLPDEMAPEGTSLAAAGLIILGINVIRRVKRLRTRGFSMVIGFLALFAGLRSLLDVDLPLIPIALIVIGAWSLLRLWFEPNPEQRGGELGTVRPDSC